MPRVCETVEPESNRTQTGRTARWTLRPELRFDAVFEVRSHPSPKRSRAKLVAARIGLILASLALGAGIVELGVRAALDLYRCDARVGWTFQRDRNGFKLNRLTKTLHRVRLNRHGFLGEDRELEKPPGVYRMLILGDSFTAGLHVAEPDAFPARLEASLNAKRADGARFEIINAGVPGYSTAQELALFREIGWKHQPDLVVLTVYLGNDLANNSVRAHPCHYLVSVCGRPFYDMREGRLVALGEGKPMRVQSDHWADRLLGFSLVYRNLVRRMPAAVSDEAPEGNVLYGIASGSRGFPSWVTTMELLIQIRDAVEVYRVPFLILIATPKPEIIPAPTSDWYRALRVRLEQLLERHEIRYIDPLQRLAESQKAGRSPYYEKDHHWNEAGHEAAATSLEAYFVDHCEELGLPLENCAPTPDPR